MTEPQIITCEQGSPEWFQHRAGIPTASMFATVLASGRGGGESLTRAKYMRQLAGEIITGEPMESFSNHHMERGKAMEGEARDFYAFITEETPELIGFIRTDRAGASPDSLIQDAGLLEIKTKLPHLMIELIMRDEFPPEHKAQVQGQLWVSGREWCDFLAYWPSMPPFIKRVGRDEEFMERLSGEIDRFNDELAGMVERVRSYGVGGFRKTEAA